MTELVNYHAQRSSGVRQRIAWYHTLVVDETAKELKVIILDVPCIVKWVPVKERALMRPVLVNQRLVIDRDEDGVQIGSHLEGGRPYSVEKAKAGFRTRWHQFNEGKLPPELRAGA